MRRTRFVARHESRLEPKLIRGAIVGDDEGARCTHRQHLLAARIVNAETLDVATHSAVENEGLQMFLGVAGDAGLATSEWLERTIVGQTRYAAGIRMRLADKSRILFPGKRAEFAIAAHPAERQTQLVPMVPLSPHRPRRSPTRIGSACVNALRSCDGLPGITRRVVLLLVSCQGGREPDASKRGDAHGHEEDDVLHQQ